jgi:hypothetical protein
MRFELKRVKYVAKTFQREALIEDVQRYNSILEAFLKGQDDIQTDDFALRPMPKKVSREYQSLLVSWKDSHRIYHLMQQAWQCTCVSRHIVHLELDQRHRDTTNGLDMIVMFGECITATPLSSLPWNKLSVAVSRAGDPSIPARNQLCLLLSQSRSLNTGARICTLADNKGVDAYGMFKSDPPIEYDYVQSLADALAHHGTHELLHVHRLVLAYNLTSLFLKLCATRWLNQDAMSRQVYIPVSPDRKELLYEQAFLSSNFQRSDDPQPSDSTFVLLGTLLLELCFNRSLEQHPKWQGWQQMTDPQSDPMLWQSVAMSWAKDVELVWSFDGAQAIHWCLHLAKAKRANWREEFASNVVHTLKTVCINSGLNIK